jgi:hypothetical protein
MSKQIITPRPDGDELVTKREFEKGLTILGGDIAKRLIEISNQIAELNDHVLSTLDNHERRLRNIEERPGIVN